ncbi:MAG: collagen-like protein, partial [Flavobacteriaceae bacterium]|nr:collagen-like protein [Flavobacteriaceae bacterium]
MSYQAVLRDSEDNLVIEQTVGMRISILQTTVSGVAVYVEIQMSSTNANGLVTLEIGTGTATVGDFSAIDWSLGPYYIKTETNIDTNPDYDIIGTSQLLSVPYALYAKESGSSIPGPQGETGPAGVDGIDGIDGIDGAQGAQGDIGNTGAQGDTGTQGIDGAQGAVGAQGDIGNTGAQGDTGTQGIDGAQGAVGAQGDIGNTGAQG